MDSEVYTNAKVRALSTKFVSLKINPEKDQAGLKMVREAGIQGYPAILWVTYKGDIVHDLRGYAPTDAFLEQMNIALKAKRK